MAGTKPELPVSFSHSVIAHGASTKRLLWALAIVTPLLAATVVAMVYVWALPPTVAEPRSDDYAVYSAFVDGFTSADLPFRIDPGIASDGVVYVVDQTATMRNPGAILPLNVAALGPADMGEDFFRESARAWRLEPRFHSKVRVSLIDDDAEHRAVLAGIPGPLEPSKKNAQREHLSHESPHHLDADNKPISAFLRLSRAGFNRRGTLALLYFSYRCGKMCGESGMAVLQKTGGQWHLQQLRPGFIY